MPDTAPPGRPNPFAWLWGEIARRYGADVAAELYAGYLVVCSARAAAIRHARPLRQAGSDRVSAGRRERED